jgi:RNase adapter protein RapZ
MRLIFVSGLSGAGKSVTLNMLEDVGFYCIDNLPAAMLTPFISHALRSQRSVFARTAVGIDARNTSAEIESVPRVIEELKRSGIRCELLLLLASDDELLRRYAETKRRHPLSQEGRDLRHAIALERQLLEPVMNAADLVIDTTRLGVHGLRDIIVQRVEQRAAGDLSITFESFGFKHGLPADADFVFDARTLPNPFWDPQLRALTGRDAEVIRYLENQPAVGKLLDDIASFVAARIPEHSASNRRYLTIAVGCTGGQHRSVYLVDRLVARFLGQYPNVLARHGSLAPR